MIKRINSYELQKDRNKDFRLFLVAFLLFVAYGIFRQVRCGFFTGGSYMTTLLAFSYLKNGFLRRGLIGTIFDLVSRVFPGIVSYKGAIVFMWGMNIIYFVTLLLFTKWIFDKIKDEKVYRGAYFFSLICYSFIVTTVCFYGGGLGRADVMQMAICLLQIYLIIEMKVEWLTVPLTCINVMFHEGYVLMTFSTVLIVLLYRALFTEGHKKKYWILFVLNILFCGLMSVLSLKGGGQVGTVECYNEAYELAKTLQKDGTIHYNLLYMMSGYQPDQAPVINDAGFVEENMKELPVFLVVFIPAFYIFGRAIVNMFKGIEKNHLGIHITAVILGPALIAVEYMKYCDYGRYIWWLVFYFFTTFLSFIVLEDKGANNAISKTFGSYSNIKGVLVTALMMIYQPLPTCSFTDISNRIMRWVNIIKK